MNGSNSREVNRAEIWWNTLLDKTDRLAVLNLSDIPEVWVAAMAIPGRSFSSFAPQLRKMIEQAYADKQKDRWLH
jgi:hypothetical protein